MAEDDTTLAHNMCVTPGFAQGAKEWRQGDGDGTPTIGGWDPVGNPVDSDAAQQRSGRAYALTVPIEGLANGDTPRLLVDYDRRGASGGSLYIGFVKNRADGHDASSYAFALTGSGFQTYTTVFPAVTEDGPHWLYIELSGVSGTSRVAINACRVHSDEADDYGHFNGDTEPPEGTELEYVWDGEPWESPSRLIEPAPEPEPEPEPEPPGEVVTLDSMESHLRAMADLGEDEDTETIRRCINTTTALIGAYTRGNGVTSDGVAAPLGAVAVLAALRLYANPTQLDNFVGSVGYRQGFTGWTLAERAALDGYRKKWA